MRNEATKWKVPKCGYRGGIMLDEMSIQEDIQLKQENGLMKLVGFTDIGEEDNAMRALKTGNNALNRGAFHSFETAYEIFSEQKDF